MIIALVVLVAVLGVMFAACNESTTSDQPSGSINYEVRQNVSLAFMILMLIAGIALNTLKIVSLGFIVMLFVLFKVVTIDIKFFNGINFARTLYRHTWVDRLLLTSYIRRIRNKYFALITDKRNCYIIKINISHINSLYIGNIRCHIAGFSKENLILSGYTNSSIIKFTCYVKSKEKTFFTLFHIKCRINSGVLNLADITNRIPILFKLSRLIRSNPSKVRLVIGVNTGHKFNVRTIFIS